MADFVPNTFGRQIRAVADGDWDAIAALINQYEPQQITGAILRTNQSLAKPTDPQMYIVVVDSTARVIAYCRSLRRDSEPPGIFRISIFVDQGACGQGIGKYLLTLAERFAYEHGGKFPMSSVEETCKRGIDFASKSGYKLVQHLFESRLDLVTFDPSPYQMAQACLEDEGFRFPNFQDLGAGDAEWQKLWELDTATDRDTPGSEFWGLGSLSQYRTRHESSFGYGPSGIHIAILKDQWVGMNMVKESPTPGEMVTDYTGVRQDFRRRGLAQVLKALGIHTAAEIGRQVMVTNNDDRNVAMLAINKKLGFVTQPGFYVVRKQL